MHRISNQYSHACQGRTVEAALGADTRVLESGGCTVGNGWTVVKGFQPQNILVDSSHRDRSVKGRQRLLGVEIGVVDRYALSSA